MFRGKFLAGLVLGFLLASLVFCVLPVGSQYAGRYDPWADIDGDGKIDMKDVGTVARGFGTYGDPAKPVIVSRHETFSQVLNFTVTAPGYYYRLNVTGYERVTVAIKVRGTATVYICWYWGEWQPLAPLIIANFTVINSEENHIWTSQIEAPLLYIYYAQVNNTINCYTIIATYLTA